MNDIIIQAEETADRQNGLLEIRQVNTLLLMKTGIDYGLNRSTPVFKAIERGLVNAVDGELGGVRKIVFDEKFIEWLTEFKPRFTS